MDNPDTANSYLLSPKAFQARLACDKSAYLIDARTPKEFADGHLGGAILIDWLDNKRFMTKAATLDKSRPIYIYCRSGVRSAEASEYLRSLGYTVYDMAGGILNWISQGLPIEK